jgi:hypothetical protein
MSGGSVACTERVGAQQAGPRYVRVSRFVTLTGYTAKAVYHKIADGIWREGCEYRRAPDGNICVDLEGFERWVEGARAQASSR